MEYENYKEFGDWKQKNKRKNLGRIGCSRSDQLTHNKRGEIRAEMRYSHHSRRKVLDRGIQDGAQEDWLPKTNTDTECSSFKKWRYWGGDICKLVNKRKTDDEKKMILEMINEFSDKIDQIRCVKCRFYFHKIREFPELLDRDNIALIKEMYRSRNDSI